MTNQDLVKNALACWTEWMQRDNSKLGYPSKSMCMESGGGAWGNFADDELETIENNLARAVDAIVDGLSNSQRLAVHYYHLGAVWRSNRTNILNDYEQALRLIEMGLRKRGML